MSHKRAKRQIVNNDRVPEPEAAAPPKSRLSLPRVPLQVFLVVSTAKPDQTAGFRRHAEKLGLGPMTVTEWKSEYKKFMEKPTN